MPQPRRNFVFWILGGGFISSLASFLYPVFRFLNPPPVSEAAVNEVTDGTVQSLPPNQGKIVRFGTEPVILIHVAQNDWRAFSAVCTHLGCIVQYDSAKQYIWCACHNGIYDLHGNVVSGPPPRPLAPYDVHIRGDQVVIAKT